MSFREGGEEDAAKTNLALARAEVLPVAKKSDPPAATTMTTNDENLVGQTQVDQWLQQTLSNMPVANWQVREGDNNETNGTLASLEKMAKTPEKVEVLNGPVMCVERVDGETVDVNMNLHFRAHFGKGKLDKGVGNGGKRMLLTDAERDYDDGDENKRLNELSPVDDRYAVARYDGDVAGLERGFLKSSDNNEPTTTTSVLSEEFKVDAKNVRLLERIAVGGFAEVFRGSYQGTVVAVKQLLERGTDVREKLENEVETLARLRHPNLLLFMGYATDPPLILTEFMRRGSLHGILKSDECFKVDGLRCRNIALAVSSGMHYLHSRDPPILHLDLKSPNILVDEKWRVKIADFGMSRERFSTLASARSEFHGTPEWMAPEMLRAEPYDERADIYSFGVVCWELLTTRTPWDDLHPMQVVAVVGYSERRLVLPDDWNKHRKENSEKPAAPTPTDALAFASLTSLFQSCAAKTPEDRPQSFEWILLGMEAENVKWRWSLPDAAAAASSKT